MLTRTLHEQLAAEVSRVDVRTFHRGAADEIERELDEHPVLVFREQALRASELADFAALLGDPEVFPSGVAHPESPIVTVISNKTEVGREAVPYWHTDGLLRARPPLRTIFYAEAVPPSGGDTLFASTELAYASLDAEDRAQLDELMLVLPGDLRHPLVRTHPRTGRRALCVNAGATLGIVGVTRASATQLVLDLIEHVTQPACVYRHRFEEGDLLVWDDYSVAHSATDPVDPATPRVMLRCDVNAA